MYRGSMTEVCSCSLREAQNKINRSWKPFITKYEFILLGWILERTYAFKKTSETIPLRHFLEGITSGGEVICYPVSMSRRTLFRTIAGLQAKNLLSVTRPGHGNCRYEILIDQDAANVCATCHCGTSRCQCDTSRCQPDTLPRVGALCARKVYNNTIRETRDLEPMKLNTPPRSASAEVVVDRLKAIAVRTAAVKQMKLSAGKFSALELHYREQIQSCWPQAPLPGMRMVDKVRFRQAFLSGTNYDPRSFIEFVVSQWGRIMKREFLNWRRTPPFPDIGFVSVHRAKFLADYTNVYLAVNAEQLQSRENNPDTDKRKDAEIADLKHQLEIANKGIVEANQEAATYHAQLMRRNNAR